MFRFFKCLRTSLWKTFPILAIVVIVCLGGCSLNNFKSEADRVPQLIEGVLSDPKTFNAALSQESPNIFGYTYEGLLTANGLTGEIEPALAESLPEVSEDKKRLVFTLKPGLKWSDGKPLTADDVVFTFNQIYFNEKIPTSTRDVFRIGESGTLPQVNKIDDRRVEFLLPEPFSPILRSLSAEILPAHVLQKSIETTNESGEPAFLATWGTETPPDRIVVNGMYRLKEYIPSQRVVFDRNPYYWRKDAEGNSQPYIDRVIWQIVENQDTQLLQFRSGGLSSVSVAPQYFSLLKQEESRGNFTIHGGDPDLGTTFISFNLNRGKDVNGKPVVDPIKSAWFNRLEFRKAIAHAIDRQTMINNIYRGLGSLQNSPLSVASPYYLSPENGLPTYEYDLEKAKQLLLSAGFQYNDRGELLDEKGNRVRFTLLTNAGNQIREAIGAQIKQDLSKIGIQVDFTPIDFNTLVTKLKDTLDWECHLIGFTGGIEPHGGSTIWSTEGRLHAFNQNREDPPISGRVIADWEREISQLYVQGAQEFDEDKRKQIYHRTQTIAQENLPFIYLVNPFSMAAVRNNIQNIQYSSLGGAYWNLYELKIQE
ncbi:MAG TPA: ABC transporter substrate-binding protein [Oscillatoriales cyanobacterium M59_W2019_021]|nr:ABC transporter substrate-binding protein [Oscillatoriales cyanobacterium M4454_W2019_049]HIK52015.1 ABC transporter substrate-binding protein [Oscillatoriales cyanobacterium M59_W2019_021]